MDKISFLIFDLDDTLIHSNIDYGTMKKRIIALFDKDPNSFSSFTIKQLLEKLHPFPNKFQQAYGIIEEMESESADKIEAIPFADTIPSFLLETKLRSAILTNNSRTSVNKYLENPKIGYLKGIGNIITRNDVSAMKPDPAGILYILDKFNLQKTEVLFIGDSFIDAEAAHKAGINFLLVNYRNLDVSAFTKFPPIQMFNQLVDIFPFIRSLLIDCVF